MGCHVVNLWEFQGHFQGSHLEFGSRPKSNPEASLEVGGGIKTTWSA